MKSIIHGLEELFGAIPLPLLEVWGRFSYVIGCAVAVCAFAGFTFRVGPRLGFGRERQAWDAKALFAMPLTFVLITASGYLGSFIVLVPGAQTFESLKDLVVFLCIVLFGYPALLTVPFAYGLSDLIEGVPPGFLLDWLPGYFVNPACFWLGYQLIGKRPDFRHAPTWGRYLLFVLLFMSVEPVLWGFLCADKFTPAISYRSITPALCFTTGITWLLAPLAMLGAYPLARRFGFFWAEIPGHVQERALRQRETVWEAGAGDAPRPANADATHLPIRMFVLAPFIVLVLVMVGVTAFVTLRSAEADAYRLADQLQREVATNVRLQLRGISGWEARTAPPADPATLSRLLAGTAIARDGRLFLFDRAGHTLADSRADDPPFAVAALDGLRRAVADPGPWRAEATYRFDYVTAKPLGRQTWFARATPIRGDASADDWLLVTALPDSFVLAGTRLGSSRSAVVFSAALLLSLALAAFIASVVAAPIRRISVATRALAAGNLAPQLPPSRLEELGALTQSFNHMARQLKKSFDDLLAEVATRKSREHELEVSESRMRVSENRLQLATTVAGLGIWDWDIARDQLIWDESMYRLYGIKQEQFGGAYDAWSRCLVREDVSRATDDVHAALRGDREFTSEFRIRWPDGSIRILRGAGRTLRNADGRPVRMVGVNWDVTEQLAAERELRQHRAHLEELVADRTNALSVAVGQAESASRAKSSFLANMSHEIRTPLNAILGFAQLMLRDRELTTTQREHLQVIDRNGAHLLSLINDILEMSKIEANRVTLNPVRFSPVLLLRDLDSMFRARAAAKGLGLRLELDPALPESAVGDEGKLRQILVNLVGNAVKFTTAGHVIVRSRACGRNDSGWGLCCEVEDTGPGIPPEDRQRLFQYFEQSAAGRHAGTGTGLGLAISREFARMMDGDIVLETAVGRGSIFRVELVLARAEGLLRPTPSRGARRVRRLAPSQPRCRLLVVDDQADNRRLARELLFGAGFEIVEAADGLEAIAVFERESPRAILMDLRMPVLDGTEAIRRLRTTPAGQAVKILALSASVFSDNRSETLAVGADDFLGKPFRESELFERLRQLLDLEYEYEDPPPPTTAAEVGAAGSAPPVPVELALALRRAVEHADLDQFLTRLPELSVVDPPLAAELQDLASRFEYDRILERLPGVTETPTP